MAAVNFRSMDEQAIREWVNQNPGRLNDVDSNGNTLLYTAAWSKTPKFMSWLLEQDADMKGTRSDGLTALHVARSAEMVSILLAAGADPAARSKTGATPLLVHVINDRIGCMRRLLQEPGVVDAIDAQRSTHAEVNCPGGSALHLVFYHKAGSEAKRAQIAGLLLHHGANPYLRNATGQTPLDVLREIDATNHDAIAHLEAAMAKRVDFSSKTEQETKAWVEANPGCVNDQDDSGWTLLTLSVQGGSLEIILWLVEKGADVECPNKHGKTPLFYATSLEIVSPLLDKGAYPAVRDLTRSTALMAHVAEGRAGCVERLLKDSRVVDAINVQSTSSSWRGSTALHLACSTDKGTESDRAFMIELLVSHNADPTLCDVQGRTALDLLRRKASPNQAAISFLAEFEQQIEEEEDKDECSICLNDLETDGSGVEVVATACQHRFHEACLARWKRVKAICPNCRRAL